MVYCTMALREPALGSPPLNAQSRRVYAEAECSKVGTLHPLLKWDAFPRYKDREEGLKGFTDKVSDVTYDLKIGKGREGRPVELVYERTALTVKEVWQERRLKPTRSSVAGGVEELPEITRREGTAEYSVDGPLEPASEYYWTVRARQTRWKGACYPMVKFFLAEGVVVLGAGPSGAWIE